MIRILTFIRTHFRTLATLFFFIIASAVLVYLLPREGKFMFEYQRGGFWKHEDLTAPFNFPVYKTKTEIVYERDSVLDEFKLIYIFDQEMADQRIEDLVEDFNAKWVEYSISEFKIPSRDVYQTDRKYQVNRQLENEYRNYISALVREIYHRGIIDMVPLEDNGQPNNQEITVVKDNVAENYNPETFYTPKTAYEYITARIKNSIPRNNRLPVRKYDQFFQNYKLNNYLSVNVIYDEDRSTKMKNSLISGISLTRGLIQEGQGIISREKLLRMRNL